MIQRTSPPAASRKWLMISGGRIRFPASRCCCMPPRASQIDKSTNPPPAVTTHVIKAAHFISSLLVGSRTTASIYRKPVVRKPRCCALARDDAHELGEPDLARRRDAHDVRPMPD